MRKSNSLKAALGLLSVLSLSAIGCGDAMPPEDMPPAMPMGTARLAFKMTDNVRQQIDPTGTATIKGTVYGDLFLSEDITVVGPIDDAKHYASIELAIDFTGTLVSKPTAMTMPLPPNRYGFLGFYDLGDKSKPADRSPSSGQPVTLALTNKFDITADTQTDYTITFDLLYN